VHAYVIAVFLFFYCYRVLRALHSFPTRRSSDLDRRGLGVDGGTGASTQEKFDGHEWGGVVIGDPGILPWSGVLCTVDLTHVSPRSEEHTSELQSRFDLVCRLLLEKKKTRNEQRS